LNGGLSMFIPPIYSPYGANGQRLTVIPGINLYDPKYLANEIPDNINNVQADPTAYIQLNPIEGLTIKTQAGIDASDQTESQLRLPSFLGDPGNGTINDIFTRDVAKTFTNTAEYKFTVA